MQYELGYLILAFLLGGAVNAFIMYLRVRFRRKLYHHYKGRAYQYQCEARHTETNELMVVYHNCDRPSEKWVRPKNIFFGKIKTEDGVEIPRFMEIK